MAILESDHLPAVDDETPLEPVAGPRKKTPSVPLIGYLLGQLEQLRSQEFNRADRSRLVAIAKRALELGTA